MALAQPQRGWVPGLHVVPGATVHWCYSGSEEAIEDVGVRHMRRRAGGFVADVACRPYCSWESFVVVRVVQGDAGRAAVASSSFRRGC